jgi:hypothetical protein
MNTDSDDNVFVDDSHHVPVTDNEIPAQGELRKLTSEEQEWLYNTCFNQLHYAREELRLQMSPAEL